MVKDVSYKSCHLFYPVKLYLKNKKYMFPDIDSLCSFCGAEDESASHLFWKDFCIFVHAFSSEFLFIKQRCFIWSSQREDKEQYFLIIIFLALFFFLFFLHKCLSFKVLSPTFLFTVRNLNPTWTLFLNPAILKLTASVL